MNASLNCTRLRQRHKSGPKGIKKKTLEKLTSIQQVPIVPRNSGSDAVRPSGVEAVDEPPKGEPQQQQQQQQSGHVQPFSDVNGAIRMPSAEDSQVFLGFDDHRATLPQHDAGAIWEASTASRGTDYLEQSARGVAGMCPSLSVPSEPAYPYTVGVEHLALYLDIYHHKLYPVWPIVHKSDLIERLSVAVPDAGAYILASSVCVAAILQLQLTATDPTGGIFQPGLIIQEIEMLRQTQDYREHPTLDSLKASFFLHVAYLHMKKQRTSTLTLREAISMAHMLDLHKESHYEGRLHDEASDDLKVLWLLFITER